jgi:ribonuclease PH
LYREGRSLSGPWVVFKQQIRSIQTIERTFRSAGFYACITGTFQLKVQFPMAYAARVELSCAVRAATSALHIFVDAQYVLALTAQHSALTTL